MSAARGGVITIVLCDDVPHLRTLLRHTFEEQPDLCVVAEAADGQAGVDEAERWQPHAVILDLSMPVMDGLQAIPRLLRVCPATSIVVFSGFTADHMEQQALGLGAHRYLEKGSDLETLVTAVRDAVSARRVA